jgi:hypothetical protein
MKLMQRNIENFSLTKEIYKVYILKLFSMGNQVCKPMLLKKVIKWAYFILLSLVNTQIHILYKYFSIFYSELNFSVQFHLLMFVFHMKLILNKSLTFTCNMWIMTDNQLYMKESWNNRQALIFGVIVVVTFVFL